MRMYGYVWGGGANNGSTVKLWSSRFFMDGAGAKGVLRSLDVFAKLNQEVKDVKEAML